MAPNPLISQQRTSAVSSTGFSGLINFCTTSISPFVTASSINALLFCFILQNRSKGVVLPKFFSIGITSSALPKSLLKVLLVLSDFVGDGDSTN